MCVVIEETDFDEVEGYKVVVKEIDAENVIHYYSPFTGIEYLPKIKNKIPVITTRTATPKCLGVNSDVVDITSRGYAHEMRGRTGIFKYELEAKRFANILNARNCLIIFEILEVKLYSTKTKPILIGEMEFDGCYTTFLGPILEIIREIN